ncbi:MAG: carbohydrate porin [Gallionellaceae bacterium]|nr:carbohydrate porin [Gallionellaceae bacterium]
MTTTININMLTKKLLILLAGTVIQGPSFAQERTVTAPNSRIDVPAETLAPNDKSSFSFEGVYKADYLRVTSGGLRRGGETMGHLDLKLSINLDKGLGWQNTTAFVNFLHDHGGEINTNHVGSLLGVSNIEVPVDTDRFFQAWLQKSWHEDRFSVLAGLYPIDTEFQVVESASLFLQPPYGPTADLSLTRGPSIFNNPAVGIRVRWRSEHRGIYIQGAALDGIPGDPAHPKGTHIKFAKGDGTMSIVELGHNRADVRTEENNANPGMQKFAIGYWQYSSKADDLVDVDANGDPVKRRSHGVYALSESSLWQGADDFDLRGFARIGATDGYSTPIQRVISVGFTINAPFASRPVDTFGVAYTYARMGDRFRTAQQVAGVTATAYESAWELTYRLMASSWFAVQPSIQYFRNPGADASIRSAKVAGMRAEFSF